MAKTPTIAELEEMSVQDLEALQQSLTVERQAIIKRAQKVAKVLDKKLAAAEEYRRAHPHPAGLQRVGG